MKTKLITGDYKIKMIGQRKNKAFLPVNDLHESDYRWFALYTKYRGEKHVIKSLLKKGIEAYTPLLRTTKKYTRKVKTYNVPLLNCYVFVRITNKEYVKVLETQHVINYVKIKKDLVAIPPQEIDLMKRVVGELEDIKVVQGSFEVGDHVEVISGKLTGLKGRLVNINGKKDFLIDLEKSGFQLLINIDPKLIRPVGLALV